MELNTYIKNILENEGIELKKDFAYERMIHAEWNNTLGCIRKQIESIDIQFEELTKATVIEDESEEIAFEAKTDPLGKLKNMLSKVGINTDEDRAYEEAECKKIMEQADNMCSADDFDVEMSIEWTYAEHKFEYKLKQTIIPVLHKQKDAEDKTLNVDNVSVVLNIDSMSYKEKPDKKQVGAIQKRIGGCKREITVEELMQVIEKGTSFKGAALNGNKNVDWESQQVFALDIDNDDASIKKYGLLTPEDACDRFSNLDVPPAFYYESFSSKEERYKFRLIFILKNAVTDIKIRNAIQLALMNIMPEADPACKDASRLFFGTNKKCKVYKTKDSTLDSYTLIQGMITYIKEKNSSSNACKKIHKYCEDVRLNMINGYPDIQLLDLCRNGKKTTSSIIYNIENDEKFPKGIAFNFYHESEVKGDCTEKVNINHKSRHNIDIIKVKHKEIRNFNFERLNTRCRLWTELIDGTKRCSHNEIFGIACNMWNVRGAEKKMVNVISNYSYTNKINKINTIRSCKSYGYLPMRCSNFCPYYERCSNKGLNILQSLDNTRGAIRAVEEIKPIKLKAAEEKLNESFIEAYSEEGNIITIIKGATGVGKTTVLNNIFSFNGLSISYSNHRLGQDIVSRIKINNSLHLKELNIEDKSVLNEFKRLQSIGAYKQARLYLEQYKDIIIEKKEQYEVDAADADKIIKLIEDYFENISKANTTKATIFSTHKKMLELNNDNIHTYIIDEDILMSSIISTECLDILEINKYIKLSCRYNANTITKCLKNLREQVIKAMENPNRALKIEKVYFDIKELNSLIQNECANLNVNLRNIINVSSIVANDNGEVLGMAIGKLPDKKCIILSATANENIYRSLFPNREIRFVDISDIETKGNVILHYTGFSRNKLCKEFDECINKIKNEANGINNVITFAKFENKVIKEGFNTIAHFGACSGLDLYKGQDLIVAGTPHADERVYRLLAAIIAGKVEECEKMSYINARRNGFEFYFNTYEEGSLMQEIQFYYIESELVQAIGRARVLRTNATVHVFSNYPVRGAVLYNQKIS